MQQNSQRCASQNRAAKKCERARQGRNLDKKAGNEKKYIFFRKFKCYLFHKSNSFVKFVPMK